MDTSAQTCESILEAGSEDYYGLYEVSANLPGASVDDQRLAAAATLQFLALEGLVQIYWGRWQLNDFTPVPNDRLSGVLNDPACWEAPRDIGEAVYVFSNTDMGDKPYKDGRFR